MGGGLPLIRVKQRRLADGGRRTDSSDSGRRLLAFRWLRETSRSVRPTQVRSPASEDRRLFCSRSRPRAWQATEHHKTTAALTRPASQPAGGHGRHPVPARSPDLARVRHHRAATRTGSSSWLRSRLVSWLALRSSETRRSVHSHAGLTCVRTRAPAHARHLHHHQKHLLPAPPPPAPPTLPHTQRACGATMRGVGAGCCGWLRRCRGCGGCCSYKLAQLVVAERQRPQSRQRRQHRERRPQLVEPQVHVLQPLRANPPSTTT
jgi:hypothetical protein